jgi:hypothetical protein
MSTIVTRAEKGSPLSFDEVDNNFTNLNNDKYQNGNALGTPASGNLTNCSSLPLTGTTGTLPINRGGTGETTAAAAFDALSPATTQGDLIYRGASGNSRLPFSSGVLVGGLVPSYSTTPAISGTNFTNVPNAALINSSLTIGTTAISLGATSLTLGGLTSIALTQDPTTALQVATKQYVDAVAEGLHIHASCSAATTATLASITGGTVTYNNGTAGVGATLTLSVALTTLDGYTLQNGDRILVKNEATQANNGIYTWATGGTVLTRATDFDTATEIASGDFTFVAYGSTYAGSGWVQTTVMVTVGTTPITFVQFSGAGTYTAGTGLTLLGTQFSLTSPVLATLGGTGQLGYATGDLLYANTPTTLSKLAIGVKNTVLSSSGTAPQWSSSLTLSGLTLSSLTSGRVTYATTDGLLTDSANLTFDGTKLTAGAVTASKLTATQAIIENAQTVSVNQTLTTGTNAMALGPITVDSGVTVTVPSGQRWIVM